MCEIKLHVKLPIFIARQWIRHRTANVNEYSARYSILSREFYIPDHDYLVAGREAQKLKKKEEKTGQSAFLELFESAPQAVAEQSTSNKQGREAAMSADEAFKPTDRIKRESARSFTAYEYLLNEDPEGNARDENRPGIARELARMVLPLNTYTEWYWKIDLHNLLHFIALRADHHAQYEIRAYADVLLDVVRSWVPHTAAAFENYRMTGTSLSGKALEAVKRMVKGESVAASDVGMSAGEWREFEKLLEIEK
jgi:thymidylate synthase (FAD)